jgi:hypothetical protein
MFPQVIEPDSQYAPSRQLPDPPHGVHTICSTFHQTGIQTYFCVPTIAADNDPLSIEWQCIQLGLPFQQQYGRFPDLINGFRRLTRRCNFLRYSTDASLIPEVALAEEFTKEHLRVTFQAMYVSEVCHIGGVFWGSKFTCPFEISEQPAVNQRYLGRCFRIGLADFANLMLLAPRHRNINSLFIVGENDFAKSSGLVEWWFTTLEHIAPFVSANQEEGRPGGRIRSSTYRQETFSHSASRPSPAFEVES